VNQNSGYIFVQSEPGHGTTFKIYLPYVGTEVRSEDTSMPRAVDVSGDETILLVEDQEAVRESAAEYLAENGYTVLRASRGLEALELRNNVKSRSTFCLPML
jgi:two-component system cell cycle sensor histidine kinase/response regulator CckA